MSDYTANILSTFHAATPEHTRDGMGWYNTAHDLALEISPNDVWRGAGVIAAFSPLTPWWRNEELAISSCRTGIARTDTLGIASRAAQRILDGEHPFDVLMGDKTRSFCENIALNGFSDAPTIDSHAYSIAIGERTFASQIKMGKRLYAEIADAYRAAADAVDLMPTQVQAITWVTWRDIHFFGAARKGGK